MVFFLAHSFSTQSPNSNQTETVSSQLLIHSLTNCVVRPPFQTRAHQLPIPVFLRFLISFVYSSKDKPQTNRHHVADIHHVCPPVQADLFFLAPGPPDLARPEPPDNFHRLHQQYQCQFRFGIPSPPVIACREALHGQRSQRVLPTAVDTEAVRVQLAVGVPLGSSTVSRPAMI